MKGIILYTSKYGSTKRYADWLAEETGFDCAEIKTVNAESLQAYDLIVFGGGIYASAIAGLSVLKKLIGKLQDKKILIFCVGAAPYEEAAFQKIKDANLTGELAGLPCFYCRGSLDIDRMSFVDKNLCRMLGKAASKKKPEERDPVESALAEAGTAGCDWTDKSYLEPILKQIKSEKQ